jgi:hypothetical protein
VTQIGKSLFLSLVSVAVGDGDGDGDGDDVDAFSSACNAVISAAASNGAVVSSSINDGCGDEDGGGGGDGVDRAAIATISQRQTELFRPNQQI